MENKKSETVLDESAYDKCSINEDNNFGENSRRKKTSNEKLETRLRIFKMKLFQKMILHFHARNVIFMVKRVLTTIVTSILRNIRKDAVLMKRNLKNPNSIYVIAVIRCI